MYEEGQEGLPAGSFPDPQGTAKRQGEAGELIRATLRGAMFGFVAAVIAALVGAVGLIMISANEPQGPPLDSWSHVWGATWVPLLCFPLVGALVGAMRGWRRLRPSRPGARALVDGSRLVTKRPAPNASDKAVLWEHKVSPTRRGSGGSRTRLDASASEVSRRTERGATGSAAVRDN